MIPLKHDSLILGYADQLIAEYKAIHPGFHLGTLEDRLATALEKIVQYIREEDTEVLT